MRDSGGPAGAGALVLAAPSAAPSTVLRSVRSAALEFRHMLHEPWAVYVSREK